MPFTPFHIEPALAAKAVLGRHFSTPVYGFTQVAIDSEVLVGYPLRGDLSFHKLLHTFAGATALTLLLLGPAPVRGMRGGTGRTKPPHEWQRESETARAIESAVAELMCNPEHAALAGRQMSATRAR